MHNVSETLRSAREGQGLSVQQVADLTKIKTEHVRDLDAGNYRGFAAPVYIRGFVRTYAAVLKLDVPRVMADLDLELSKTKEFNGPPSLTGSRREPLDFITLWLSRMNWRVASLIGGAIAACMGIWWFLYSPAPRPPADPLAGLKPALYRPVEDQAGELAPLHSNATTTVSQPSAPSAERRQTR